MSTLVLWLKGEGTDLLGLHTAPADMTFVNMACRGFVVLLWGILIVRLGDRRLLGRNAGFDMLLVVVLGSVLSRAVNGQSAFFPTLGVSGFLILLHHGLGIATKRSHWLSRWVKGQPQVLIANGQVDEAAMQRAKVSRDDLEENLRLNGNVASVEPVAEARLERNGAISVVKK